MTHQLVRKLMTFDDQLDDIKRARIWSALEDKILDEEAPRARRWPYAIAAVAAVAAAALLLLRGEDDARRLAVPAETQVTAQIGPHTRAALVGPAQLDFVGAPGDATVVRMRRGTLLADFAGGTGRSLRIETRGAVVEVVGTLFAVRVDDAVTCTSVEHGRVRVTTPSGVTYVGAGERFCTNEPAVRAIEPAVRESLEGHRKVITASAPAPAAAPAPVVTPIDVGVDVDVPATAAKADAASKAAPAASKFDSATVSKPAVASKADAASKSTAKFDSATVSKLDGSRSTSMSREREPEPEPVPAPAPAPVPAPATSISAATSASQPATSQAAAKPATVDKPTSQPTTSQPTASQPTTSQPTTSQPAAKLATVDKPPNIDKPASADELYRRAEAALAARDAKTADRMLASLLAQHPSSPLVDQALYDRARIAYQQRAWPAAREHLDKLATVASSRLAEPGHYLRCRIAVEAKDNTASACFLDYRRRFPRAPHDLDALAVLAQHAHGRGGCDAARAFIDELLAAYPRTTVAATWRERCEVKP